MNYLLYFMMSILCLSSCNLQDSSPTDSTRYQLAFKVAAYKIRVFKSSRPDSVIKFADKAIALLQNMQSGNTDTLISIMHLKAEAFLLKERPDSALPILEKARIIAIDESDTPCIAKASLHLGEFHFDRDNFYLSEKFLLEAVNFYEKSNHDYEKGKAYNMLGCLCISKGNNHNAQQYLLKAYKIFDQTNDLKALSGICINIGNNFMATNSRKEELHYYRMAVNAASNAHDTIKLLSALTNIGVFYRFDFPDSALAYYNKAISLKPAENTLRPMIIARYNKANIYLDRKEFSQASQQFEQLLEICRKEKITGGIARTYSAISSLHDETGNHVLATKYLLLALHLADSTGETSLAIDLMDQLMHLYKENGQFKNAMRFSERFQAVRDSIQTIDKQLAIHEMEMLYQTEKKDKENLRLKTFVTNQKESLNNRHLIIIILMATIFILVILFWIGLKLYRQRGYAYNALMIKYKTEKDFHIATLLPHPVITNPTDNTIPQKTKDEPLIASLFHYFRTEKPYLDPKLKVDSVAVRLNSTQKAISAALNNYNGSNFTSFTNQFRVEEVKRIMDEDPLQSYKIEAIAAEAGFGTRQSFYNAFEQYTGVKPRYYRKNIQDREHYHR